MGEMGLNNQQKHPPTPNIALSAKSRKRIEIKHNSKEYVEGLYYQNESYKYKCLELDNYFSSTLYPK